MPQAEKVAGSRLLAKSCKSVDGCHTDREVGCWFSKCPRSNHSSQPHDELTRPAHAKHMSLEALSFSVGCFLGSDLLLANKYPFWNSYLRRDSYSIVRWSSYHPTQLPPAGEEKVGGHSDVEASPANAECVTQDGGHDGKPEECLGRDAEVDVTARQHILSMLPCFRQLILSTIFYSLGC